MKKLFVLIAALALITYGCKKDQPQPTNQLVDVSFSASLMSKNLTKADTCSFDLADYVKVVIDGTTYTLDVYYIDGVPYTKSVKLSAPETGEATHTITQFFIYSDMNTPDTDDDDILAATPADNSDYVGYVTDGVPMTFTLGGFVKKEIPIEVLCFADYEYTEFGFFWYTFDELIIRTQCFFGDLCVKDADPYANSLYADQTGFPKLDLGAIFQIEVFVNGYQKGYFNNEAWWGEGAPLCIEYADTVGQIDTYEFVLSVLVDDGSSVGYKVFHTWQFTDDNKIAAGDDGIVDFVVGNCVQSFTDFVFPPYMDLPASCTLTLSTSYYPGPSGLASMDATLSGIGTGYDLHDATYPTWCFDRTINITVGVPYAMNVFSSLYPNLMPPQLQNKDWSRANWIINNLDLFPTSSWKEVQAAFWLLENPSWNGIEAGYPTYNFADAQAIYTAAVAAVPNPATDPYAPPPGGWAAVAFAHADGAVQAVFVLVDP